MVRLNRAVNAIAEAPKIRHIRIPLKKSLRKEVLFDL